MCPATEPQLSVGNENYPPAVGASQVDDTSRSPFWLALPIAFGTADAAALYTVPSGKRMHIDQIAWEVTTGFTGGASSAIGVSSDDAFCNTKGDLLGGASGDLAALLVVADGTTGGPLKGGTVGAKRTDTNIICLRSGKIIRFDRITSAFTAGAGFVHVLCSFVPTS